MNSRPRLPSWIRVRPSLKLISSATDAIWASSRFEQPEKSGTPRISSTFASFRSTPASLNR